MPRMTSTGTHTYANTKNWLVEVEVDVPLHDTLYTLFSVASTTVAKKKRALNYTPHSTLT